MRCKIHPDCVKVWITAGETWAWAHRPGDSWPGSDLAGRRVFAEFDRNGIVDLAVDGSSEWDGTATELSACCSDHLAKRLPKAHPAYFVAVGQFLKDGAR